MSKITHGHSIGGKVTTEYATWHAMINRCHNKNRDNYKYYGARGISVCDRWRKFDNFINDMGKKPNKTYSIERVDNDKGYYKENCIWADKFTQGANQSIRTDNKSGTRGVRQRSNGTWRSGIGVKNKFINLGSFKMKEDAISARKNAELKYWGVNHDG